MKIVCLKCVQIISVCVCVCVGRGGGGGGGEEGGEGIGWGLAHRKFSYFRLSDITSATFSGSYLLNLFL